MDWLWWVAVGWAFCLVVWAAAMYSAADGED
jgi:hypothetical protein